MNKLQQKIQSVISLVAIAVLVFFSCLNIVFSQEYNSLNFKVLDPVTTSGGGYSSSLNYKLDSSIGQISTGTSSATNFNLNAGFLYFPYVSTPVVSATAGDSQASLSWTAASGVLGWTASGYNVGVSTVSGGPYAFSSSLGNVLFSTRTGLSNGTPYYFVIRVEDVFGNIIATSSQVSATPAAAATPPSGGGGGGGEPVLSTGVIFSGRAYPLSHVSVLKDGQLAVTTIADPNSNFNISLTNLSSGNYTFSVYGEDSSGRRSPNFTFTLFITSGVVTNIGGIFIAPTIAVDKSEVKRGDNIAIFGQSVSQANIVISVHSNEEIFTTTVSDNDGVYLYNFDTSQVEYGDHNTKSKASIDQKISDFSKTIAFKVGTKNVTAEAPKTCPIKGDLNADCKVNLVDFSIAAYWYKSPLSEAFKNIELVKLNGDGKVNLIDFSIMAFYWTG